MLVAVPPLAISVVLTIAGVSYSRSIEAIVVGRVLRSALGAVAGRRAGLTVVPLVLSITYGLLLGSTILVLQALLQPGHRPFRP
jgi:NAD/NADP transhydrogenase beta subunit